MTNARGAGVAQQCRQFPAGQTRIERHPHEARRHDGVVGLEIFADIGNKQRDAIAFAQPKPGQCVAEACDAGVDIAVGPAPAIVDDRGVIAMLSRELAPFRSDVHVTSPRARPGR